MFDRIGEDLERLGAALGRLGAALGRAWAPREPWGRAEDLPPLAAARKRVEQRRRDVARRYGLAPRRWDKDEHDES